MPRKPVKNGFQRRQFRRGERRLRSDEVKHYLALADSEDPQDQIEAMENLCPCHVRKQIDVVWEALYRGLQDRALKVRQAAWHTLEDGGRPNDSKLYLIMVELTNTETNPKLKQQATKLVQAVQIVEDKKQDLSGQRHHYFTGKCDWCGDSIAKVCQLYDSELEIEGTVRLAQVCDGCQSEYKL
ncbi:TPA: hypothetical protein EYO57_32600 [Candidatus Poribacteria bacterium]|nr:hypothetical protein [Candidatus Poribacteria bacterium]